MSAKLGSLSIFYVQLGLRKLSVIRSSGAGCLLFRGYLSIEVDGRTQSGLSELSVISWVSVKVGQP